MKFKNFILPGLITLNVVFCRVSQAQLGSSPSSASTSSSISAVVTDEKQKVVIVTGVRFSYPLLQKWIDEYNKENTNSQIVIEARGSSDPKTFDVLAEVYEHDPEVRKNREYTYVGRYAVLPVANSNSAFARTYTDKGLNEQLIKQLYFYEGLAEDEEEVIIKHPYTVYTRMQRAGAPIVFTKYFGFEQKDIKGKAIAGADEHLLKALLRDSTGLSYLPLALIYDHQTGKPIKGLSVLPVDLNGNGRVSDEEKFYGNLPEVIKRLEGENMQNINNLPIEYLHLSVSKQSASSEAIDFVKWVSINGDQYLHEFGYLKPEGKATEAAVSDRQIPSKSKK